MTKIPFFSQLFPLLLIVILYDINLKKQFCFHISAHKFSGTAMSMNYLVSYEFPGFIDKIYY
jgi:hypothetical protein